MAAPESGFLSQFNTPLGWLAVLSQLLGTGSQAYGAYDQLQRQRQIERLVKRGPDWRRFYQPLSQQAQAAVERRLGADLAVRGIPQDSAYRAGLTAEVMGNIEAQLVQDAMARAQSAWATEIEARQGAPGMRVGDPSALKWYLIWRALQDKKKSPAKDREEAATGQAYTGDAEAYGQAYGRDWGWLGTSDLIPMDFGPSTADWPVP